MPFAGPVTFVIGIFVLVAGEVYARQQDAWILQLVGGTTAFLGAALIACGG